MTCIKNANKAATVRNNVWSCAGVVNLNMPPLPESLKYAVTIYRDFESNRD